MYSYFVSYQSMSRSGMINIKTNEKIKTYDDLIELAKHIEAINNYREVVILNYKLIEELEV